MASSGYFGTRWRDEALEGKPLKWYVYWYETRGRPKRQYRTLFRLQAIRYAPETKQPWEEEE
jgi:hypothetical protein